MARACPSKTEGVTEVYTQEIYFSPTQFSIKGCRATMDGHASCVLHNCKKCHSQVGMQVTCTEVQRAAMKERLGNTKEITYGTQPSSLEGARLEIGEPLLLSMGKSLPGHEGLHFSH